MSCDPLYDDAVYKNTNSPLSGHRKESNAGGLPERRGGGMLKFRLNRRITILSVFLKNTRTRKHVSHLPLARDLQAFSRVLVTSCVGLLRQ